MSFTETTKTILQDAHESARAEARQFLPEQDVNTIINLVIAVLKEEKTAEQAAKELAHGYIPAAKAYANAFANVAVRETLEAVDIEELNTLAGTDFSEKLVACAATIGTAVIDFKQGKIPAEDLIEILGDSGIKDLGNQVMAAFGIDVQAIQANIREITCLEISTMAVAAFAASYKLLEKALRDEELAYERRLQIEAECRQSVEMIRQYRTEMEEVVSNYLSTRLETFEEGFRAMDQALLDGDTDGYLRGNAQIQEILGYRAQFTTQDEFDALMDSDFDFKL